MRSLVQQERPSRPSAGYVELRSCVRSYLPVYLMTGTRPGRYPLYLAQARVRDVLALHIARARTNVFS